MSTGNILLLVIVLLLVGVNPVWPHSRTWGYAPSSSMGILLLLVLVLILMGRV
ncbi:DUF3309 family protein [Methylomonas sp. AM2-LC]|uniref:DUF3309 family protein n=1 Tax=Methylomonas sp. AM2-LC TaxID=3153301 RepID=UPI003266ABB9